MPRQESSGTTHELVQAQWRLGQVYAQQGQPKEAERLLLKVFSQRHRFLFQLCRSVVRYGEEGLQHPDSLQALIDHAVSLQQMGHFAIAQATWQRAVEKHVCPGSTSALLEVHQRIATWLYRGALVDQSFFTFPHTWRVCLSTPINV